MGFRDTLCFLCGVSPGGGPTYLAEEWRIEECLDLGPVIAELRERGVGDQLADKDVSLILTECFYASIANGGLLPPGYGNCDYSQNHIGIGRWDAQGLYHDPVPRSNLIQDGRGIQVLRLRGADGYVGRFVFILEKGEDGKFKKVWRTTYCGGVDSPCLWICEHCYHFLSAWIDMRNFPARSYAFPDDSSPLNFDEELYEIVNSRRRKRCMSRRFSQVQI